VYDIDTANAAKVTEKVRDATAGPPWYLSSPIVVSFFLNLHFVSKLAGSRVPCFNTQFLTACNAIINTE
jgi:hypothetical protein